MGSGRGAAGRDASGYGAAELITVRGLTIAARGGAEILRSVDISVGIGESVVVLGPSGAGKTTLALALLGRIRPGLIRRAGTIRMEAIDIFDADRRTLRRLRRDRIHYLPQDPLAALTPTSRVGTLLAEAIGTRRSDPSVIAALLRRVRLPADAPGFLRRRPHQLSGGQRQRLLLAMALAGPPAAIVLDEPTAGQDPQTRDALLAEIQRLRRDSGVALLTITHDPAVADRLGETVLRLRDGRLTPRPDAPTPSIPWPDDPSPGAPQPGASPPSARCLRAVAPAASFRRPMPNAVQPASQAERTPVLVAEDLSARYGVSTVVHHADLALYPGEIVALIGRSGAGKTTLARVLAGLHPAAAGHHRLAVTATTTPPRRQRHRRVAVGFVYQDPYSSLNPARAVRRIVADATGEDRKTALAIADQLLAEVGLTAQLARRRPGQLSGGQQQRAAIARALATAAPVMICDEPTSALDPATRDAICDLLHALCRTRLLAILLISHDQAAVNRIATRTIVIRDGHLDEAIPTVDSDTACPDADPHQRVDMQRRA